MSNDSLTIAFTVRATPEAAFAAITSVRDWWPGQVDGPTDWLGAAFTYRYADVHRSTRRISELVPGRRVAWHVEDGHLSFVPDPAEWAGTDIVFEITPAGAGTEVRFTHVGLAPAVACFGQCSGAWHLYIGRLRDLIAGGPTRRAAGSRP
ncbi:MAG TPA: SRPBCC domain-containing protein [Trebonia sp.]|jgi:hypothetical protein|nr:SRPBCC domain-containing protein [Trebonia sp.]